MLATLEYGMGLRDSAIIIVFFAMLTCIPPAVMCMAGPQTGLRQLVQARYSFGYEMPLLQFESWKFGPNLDTAAYTLLPSRFS